jgi:hypothetical protein
MVQPDAAADEADQVKILLCKDQPQIELDSCREAAPDEAPAPSPEEFFFVLRNGCLGKPNAIKAHGCATVQLIEQATRLPVQQALLEIHSQDEGKNRIVVQRVTGVTAQIPAWADEVRLSSRRLEDRLLDPADVPAVVLFRPGRELRVRCVVEPDVTAPEQVDLSLGGIDIDHDLNVEIDPEQQQSLGGVPLGRYRLRLYGDGFSPINQELMVNQGETPVLLELPLISGACAVIPVDTEAAPDTTSLVFHLAQTGKNRFTIHDYLQGTVELTWNAGLGLKQVRFCGLSPAWYDLSLEGKGLATEVISFELGKTDLTLATLYLTRAGMVTLSVIDDTNQPLAGAEVFFTWGEPGQRRAVKRQTGPQGKVTVPALAEPAQMTAFVRADGYQATSELLSSIQDKVIMLEPTGHLTGTADHEVCHRSRLSYVLKRPCRYLNRPEGCWEPFRTGFFEECELSEEINEPGEIQVTITAPDYARYQEVINIGADLDHDLGMIRLEPGHDLDVEVVSRNGPVAGATVEIPDHAAPVMTDAGGYAVFSALPEEIDKVALIVSHPDYARVWQEVTVPDNRSVVIELPMPGTIFGKVLDDDGSPAAGETISAIGPDRLGHTETISHRGSYRFEGLTPGRWQISRQSIQQRFMSVRQSGGGTKFAVVHENEEVQVDFIPEVRVHGRVTLGGKPLANAWLVAVSSDGAHLVNFATDDSGRYTTDLTRPGPWMISHRGSTTAIEVQGPCPYLVDIELESLSGGRSLEH